MDFTLFSEEEILVLSDDKKVFLTNKRFIINSRLHAFSAYLEEISSVKVTKYGDGYMLILGIIVGIILEMNILHLFGYYSIYAHIVTAVVFVVLWLCFHRSKITIFLNNGRKVNILINSKYLSKISTFVDRLEAERKHRLKEVTQLPIS